jgi:uncharacterized protein YndB with AHSA1/START domain
VIDADRVSVTTIIAVEPARAFEVFTEEIDLWWRRDSRFRNMGTDRTLAFEPGPEGRLVAYAESGSVFEIGKVLAWEPPKRLVFSWRARNFEGDESTEVEVRFEPVEPGTRVTLEHRGFDALRADHPVRHGLAGEAFLNLFGTWWGDLLVAFRAHATRS